MSDSERSGRFARQTRETRVEATVRLDGGERRIDVPDGFLGHMLDALALHGGLGLDVVAAGDTHVDSHHTVEDTGIALGECLRAALGDRAGVQRFAHAYAPLDEALARAVIDLSGRGFFAGRLPAELEQAWVTQDFPLTLVADFFQALATHAGITLHLDVLAGRNPHHVAESCFKAFALALRAAASRRVTTGADIPSTKGVLE